MLILILIDVRYSQKAVFSFEEGLNRQNHAYSGPHHQVKTFPPAKFLIPPPPFPPPSPLDAIWKTLFTGAISHLHRCAPKMTKNYNL